MSQKVTDKVELKKQQIVLDITDFVFENGLSDLGLRKLAAVSDTSDRMLIYYFGTKDSLIGTVLQSIAANLTLQFDEALGRIAISAEEMVKHIKSLTKFC